MAKIDLSNLEELAKLVRYFILTSSTEAGSGHPTSSLSATDLMTALFFAGYYRYDLKNPQNPNNDRLIFSKGHASPLFFSIYAAASAISEKELLTLRKFGSKLEGHPTMEFPHTVAPTGSLGQGLSIGVGIALNAKYLDKLPYKTYILLGDSEMAEGSVWEAMQIAAHYKLNNLVGILDANRLGQSTVTMYGHDVKNYEKKISSFGWETIIIDGHNMEEIIKAFEKTQNVNDKPVMIIAKTIKGKGVSFLEDLEGWHGKALKKEELEKALSELGTVDKKLRGKMYKPKPVIASARRYEVASTLGVKQSNNRTKIATNSLNSRNYMGYKPGEKVATRKAYGNALVRIYPEFPEIVSLDGETSNSTFSEIFRKEHPDKYFEMYIAEQNMVGTAIGLSSRGKIPFVSTFAAFFSRAFDQIRMSQYSNSNIKFVGSHSGVSIGEDGASQMGLEEIALFRTLLGSVIFYPSDAVSAEKLVEESAKHFGNVYIQTTRMETPVIYENTETFKIGGSIVLKKSAKDKITVVGAGVTLHEALKAYEELKKSGINIRVIDLYSIKPVDQKTLRNASVETDGILVVEDHFAQGGIADAVREALSENGAKIHSLAVRKMPKSGKPEELLDYEEINAKAIISKIKKLIR